MPSVDVSDAASDPMQRAEIQIGQPLDREGERAPHDVESARTSRRQYIIHIAGEIFLANGYSATSMSSIAARLGGSKGTLYNYFSSKEALFSAFLQEQLGVEERLSLSFGFCADDIELALQEIGCRFLDLILSERAETITRLVIAESKRFPWVGQAFYENGPLQGVQMMARWVEAQAKSGRLRKGDAEQQAMIFLELCKSGLQQRILLNLGARPTPAETAKSVAEATRVFLAAYGDQAVQLKS